MEASYHLDGKVDVWDGSFKLRLPPVGPGPTVGSALQVRNGLLTKLEVEMKKENPGWGPIACCAYMTRLKGSYTGPDEKVSSHYAIGAETDLTAGPKILGWSLLKLTAAGRLHWHPDFGAMLEVDGEMFLAEKFSIATASLWAKMGAGNTWVWFEGTAKWDMIVFSAKGTVSGEIGDPTGKSPGQWYLGGGVDLCVEFVDLCAGGKVAASTKGVAGCLYLDLDYTGIAAGGVYYWNGNWSTFWGCSKEKIKGKVGALQLAASAAETAALHDHHPGGDAQLPRQGLGRRRGAARRARRADGPTDRHARAGRAEDRWQDVARGRRPFRERDLRRHRTAGAGGVADRAAAGLRPDPQHRCGRAAAGPTRYRLGGGQGRPPGAPL